MALEQVIRCPVCGRANQAHAGVDNNTSDVPTPGAISICWGCRSIAIYDHNDGRLTLRRPTRDELLDALEDPDVQSALQAMKVQPTPAATIAAIAATRGDRPHYRDGGFAGGGPE